jgi:hypothetical protein
MPDDLPDAPLTDGDIIYAISWMMGAQARQYDCMLALISALGHPERAKQLQSLHARGEFLFPPDWAMHGAHDSPGAEQDGIE